MTLDEQLSRYLDGDLPASLVAPLEHRLAEEPEVAAALAEMESLRSALGRLPRELDPPPLRQRGAGARARWGTLVAVLAAGFLVWLAWPSPRAQVVLAHGVTELSGDMDIEAGALQIQLDGRARISVEPLGGVARGAGGVTEESMDPRMVISAAAGAAVTVVVMQGTAWVSGPSADAVALEAGQTQSFGASGAVSAPLPDDPRARAEALQERMRALDQELQATRSALAEEQFAGDLARGQLAQLRGEPSPWPDDVPEPFTPDAFQSALQEQLKDLPVEIARVDCSEYPCVAALAYTGDDPGDDDWMDDVGENLQGWLQAEMGEAAGGVSVSMNRSRFADNGSEASFVVFAGHEGKRDDNVGRRTEARIGAVVDELGDQVEAQDIDVDQ